MIYLDNAATTPVDPIVLDAMMPYLKENFGNPGSLHKLGRDAKEAVENARVQVAKLINARPEQIIFTSGATEANNTVVEMIRKYLQNTPKKHILVSAIEHKSVLNPVSSLTELGFDISFLNATPYEMLRQSELDQGLREDTGFVSVMYVNNETGFTHDVHLVGKTCNEKGILFHTDCVQAAGCVSIDVEKIGCDFATLSSHKIHGPKGVGALYVRDKSLFEPMIRGGADQEFGMRGGTENVAGIVGFGKACELAKSGLSVISMAHTETLKREFYGTLLKTLGDLGLPNAVKLNTMSRIGAKVLSLRVDGVDAESLVLAMESDGVCISAGSACNSHESIPSYVLTATGLTDDEARSSVRVSVSRMNTPSEVKTAAVKMAERIKALRFFNG